MPCACFPFRRPSAPQDAIQRAGRAPGPGINRQCGGAAAAALAACSGGVYVPAPWPRPAKTAVSNALGQVHVRHAALAKRQLLEGASRLQLLHLTCHRCGWWREHVSVCEAAGANCNLRVRWLCTSQFPLTFITISNYTPSFLIFLSHVHSFYSHTCTQIFILHRCYVDFIFISSSG